jgi:hypothetical protein
VADAPDETLKDESGAAHKGGAWRWWLVGLAGAVALGTFMWAVDGRFNTNAPKPSGPAATPAEAVLKFLEAVDNHDAPLARSYASPNLAPHVDDWIDRAGYVRLVKADETALARTARAAPTPGAKTLDVTYEAVTPFLDDDDPLGLNLALLVWTEQVSHPWVVVPGAGGAGWVVDDAGKPLRK